MINTLNIKNLNIYNGIISNTVYLLLLIIIGTTLVGCSEDSRQENKNPYETYEVNAPSQLVVRSFPSKESAKTKSLPHKSIIHVDTIENGWAHVVSDEYDGYVNTEYIRLITTSSDRNAHTDNTDRTNSGLDMKELGEKTFPYIILVLAILTLILLYQDKDEYLEWMLLPLSLCEIGYLLCSDGGYDAWFLSNLKVGWIMVIINYLVTFAVLVLQGFLVLIVISRSSSGWFTGIINAIFSLLAGVSAYGLFGVKLDTVLAGLVSLFFVILASVLYYSLRNGYSVFKYIVINTIAVTTYAILLINMLNLIIVVVIALIGVCIFTAGPSSNSRSPLSSGNLGRRPSTPNNGISMSIEARLNEVDDYTRKYNYYRQKAEEAMRNAQAYELRADDETNKASLYNEPSHLDKAREYSSWAERYTSEAISYAQEAERYLQLAEMARDFANASK